MEKVPNDNKPTEKKSLQNMTDTFIQQNYLVLMLIFIAALLAVASCVIYAKIVNLSSEPIKHRRPTYESCPFVLDCLSCYPEVTVTRKPFIPRPTCPYRRKTEQFKALLPRFYCTLEDVYNPEARKIPIIYTRKPLQVKNNSNNETQKGTVSDAVVNYIIAALLFTSLGAALLEFYRAKTSRNKKNETKGAKAPLNKKCSLADLTVLKHHRRELVRRESILEPHCEDEGNYQQHQGFQPSPLQRRCSFPASLSSSDDPILGRVGCSRRNSRKLSMAGDFGRRMSAVNEVRKLSILPDDELWRRGSLVGDDYSPDRRVHHSRLVHRH